MKLKILLRIVGVVQLILGAFYLFLPLQFLSMQGLSIPSADNAYPLGMLAARFLAYGIGMLAIANFPEKNLFWIKNMILVQAIDLMVGIFYTATSVISLPHSIFPMFNATLFIILLTLWRPKASQA